MSREASLRRQIRETWSDLLREKTDHVRAAALHRRLASLKQALALAKAEREEGR